eukprot:g4740.t1
MRGVELAFPPTAEVTAKLTITRLDPCFRMRFETTTSAQARTNRKQRNIGNLAKGACRPCPCLSLWRAHSRRCGLQALQIPRYSYSFHRYG